MKFEKFGVPKECFEQYGRDLDGCSTQENEGCSRCRLFNGSGEEPEIVGVMFPAECDEC